MATVTVPQARIRRSTARTRATRQIHNTEKLLTLDIRDIPTDDLRRKLEAFKAAMQGELEAQDQLLNIMAAEGASEEDLQKEVDNNLKVEDIYDGHIEKMQDAIDKGTFFLRHQELRSSADSWLMHGVPTSADFATSGNKWVSEMQGLIRSLNPHSTHATLGTILTSLKSQLEQVMTVLHQKVPPSAAAAAAPATAALTPARKPAPYQIKAPTFSGKALDYPSFEERLTEVMKCHWDSYTDSDRVSILSEAMMDPSAKELVNTYASSGYETALKQLKERYGRNSVIYPKYVEDLVARSRYEYDQESMTNIIRRVEYNLDGMDKIGAKTIEQMVVALVVRDFNEELHKEWARHLGSSDKIPDREKLMEFVRPLSHNLPARSKPPNHHPNNSKATAKKEDSVSSPSSTSRKSTTSSATNIHNKACALCKGSNHSWARCQIFLDADLNQRWALIRQHKYCANCLHQSHQVNNCASTFTCRECKARHHSLLHRGDDTSANKTSKQTGNTLMTSVKPKSSPTDKSTTVKQLRGASIRTALCTVYNGHRSITIRVAFDTCCTHSIITERVASHLHVQWFPVNVDMKGPVSTVHLTHGVTIEVGPAFPSPEKVKLDAAVTSLSFCSTPPDGVEDLLQLPLLQGLKLSDAEFGGPIDFILGTYDQSDFITAEPTRFSRDQHITASSTTLGWTVTAPTSGKDSLTIYSVELQENPLDHLLSQLWQLEQVPSHSTFSPEEESALQQFRDTVQIQEDGRYSVSLPRVNNPPKLGQSLKMATSRFLSNERSLKKRGKLLDFNNELSGYLTLKHAETVPTNELGRDHFYLPVHGVFKTSSTTTKVRPVFDGSAKSSSGASLNDLLLTGPSFYHHIEDILLVFRQHRIAFSADISKMFREILLNVSERDLHRFLIRNSSGELTSLRMTRLTFGVKPSPFLATLVLLHLANRFQTSHPLAVSCVRSHFYVDDLLTGADNLQDAVDKREQICSLLSEAKMLIRKWRTNDCSFRSTIPTELIEMADLELPSAKDSSKALGIHWQVAEDCLHVAAPDPPQSSIATKRLISSISAQIFDTMGFFAPYIVRAKILLQELWLLKISWDTAAPEPVQQRWVAWTKDLPLVTAHPVPRRYHSNPARVRFQSLQGFSDASELAYGAVVYMRTVFEDGSINCSFVIARARVRPLKVTTIPKLELQAATLLTQLLVYTSKLLNIPKTQIQPWTDSSIVLSWLRKPPHSITEVFVRNRISTIQDSLPDSLWRHVPTKSNPADLASRGTTVPELTSSTLWWSGPAWLSCSENNWPTASATPLPRELPGVVATVLSTALLPVEEWWVWSNYSNYNTLLRILCWIFRLSGIPSLARHPSSLQCSLPLNLLMAEDSSSCFSNGSPSRKS